MSVFVFLCRGSCGDVMPIVALAVGLALRGEHIAIVTLKSLHALVISELRRFPDACKEIELRTIDPQSQICEEGQLGNCSLSML
jgi:UDP:flavonoid glycosyltransferase YjiC (YdhE family)